MQHIDRSVMINASPAAVWDALTMPSLMKQWMAEPEMAIEILTDWQVGSPIMIQGFHHLRFENKGTVLQYEPHSVLQYSHLSSLSRLPDQPQNYSVFAFRLAPLAHQTSLTLTLSNFPTDAILKHLDLYWKVALAVMQRVVENQWIEKPV